MNKIEELIGFLNNTVKKLDLSKEELNNLIKGDPYGKFKFSSIVQHIEDELARVYSLTHDWKQVELTNQDISYEYKCLTCGTIGFVCTKPTRTIRTDAVISCNEQLILNIIE